MAEFIIESSGNPADPDYRKITAYCSNALIQDKATSGLPNRRVVNQIKAQSNTNTQLYFAIEVRQTVNGSATMQLWKGATYTVGPTDDPMYLIDDPTDDNNQTLIWGTAPDANGLPEFVVNEFQATDPNGNPTG